MKKTVASALFFFLAAGLSGCSHMNLSTPAVMTYDGSSVDYSKIESMKTAKICKKLNSPDGDTTIISAAKEGNISKIKHVDTSVEFSRFLFWKIGERSCVTVYGE